MELNRNLLILSLFLILAGFFSGLFLISFFGLLLLIPALSSASRPPTRPSPYQPKPAPRRITPPTASSPPPSSASAPTSMATPAPVYAPPPQAQSYSPALFPSPMMPSLSTMGSTQPMMEPVPTRKDGKDELVEAGAILAALKIIFG